MLKAVYHDNIGLVVTTVSGMNGPEEMEAYVAEVQHLRDRQRAKDGRFLHLVDVRGGTVQSQISSEKLSQLVQSDSGISANDKTAVVLNSAMLKMQVARLTSHMPYAVFADFDEAVAWLKSDSA